MFQAQTPNTRYIETNLTIMNEQFREALTELCCLKTITNLGRLQGKLVE